MKTGRWVIASCVIAIALIILDMIYNGVLLKGLYMQTAFLWRPEMQIDRLAFWGWLATIAVSFILVYIYHRGYEGRGSGLAEGLRFGFFIGLFVAIPMATWSFVSMPIPFALAAWWFIIAMVKMLVAGAIAGLIYKRPA